jgi:hypothetical protein
MYLTKSFQQLVQSDFPSTSMDEVINYAEAAYKRVFRPRNAIVNQRNAIFSPRNAIFQCGPHKKTSNSGKKIRLEPSGILFAEG